MLNLTAFSQKGTVDSIPTKTFTLPVVKAIVKDLMSGDSAKKQLILTEKELALTKNIVSLKDSVIISLEKKVENQKLITQEEKNRGDVIENQLNISNKELKKEKFKNKLTKFVSSGLIVALSVLLILR
jgi:hypothetical protein